MRAFAKPRVVVSKCLEFAACRYDGQMISDSLVRRLKEFVEFVPVCPGSRNPVRRAFARVLKTELDVVEACLY